MRVRRSKKDKLAIVRLCFTQEALDAVREDECFAAICKGGIGTSGDWQSLVCTADDAAVDVTKWTQTDIDKHCDELVGILAVWDCADIYKLRTQWDCYLKNVHAKAHHGKKNPPQFDETANYLYSCDRADIVASVLKAFEDSDGVDRWEGAFADVHVWMKEYTGSPEPSCGPRRRRTVLPTNQQKRRKSSAPPTAHRLWKY